MSTRTIFIVFGLTVLACVAFCAIFALTAVFYTIWTGESVAEASDITEITVYTAVEDELLQPYLALFEQDHPEIKVNIVRDSTGVMTERLLREKDNPQADVVWGLAATSLVLAQSEGILQPYAPAGFERIDAKFRDIGYPPSWIGIDVWMSAFCVNTQEAERLGLPIPESWEDLINPVYKGYIVMPNPNSSGTGFLSVVAMLQLKGREKGWVYLDQLHENVALYTHSGSKPCTLAGTGEYPIGISFGYRGIVQQQAGDPIVTIFPKEGSGWEMEANALIKKRSIKAAAKTFLDWAISDQIMREYAKNFAITGARTDQPIPEGYPSDPINQLIDNNFSWTAANRRAILQEWLSRYESKSEP